MPKSPDLEILVLTNNRSTDDRRTKPITLPLVHVCRVTIALVQAINGNLVSLARITPTNLLLYKRNYDNYQQCTNVLAL